MAINYDAVYAELTKALVPPENDADVHGFMGSGKYIRVLKSVSFNTPRKSGKTAWARGKVNELPEAVLFAGPHADPVGIDIFLTVSGPAFQNFWTENVKTFFIDDASSEAMVQTYEELVSFLSEKDYSYLKDVKIIKVG